MQKAIVILFIFLPFISVKVLGQKQGQALVDSLLAELPAAKEDTNRVNLFSMLSAAYYSINPDKGIQYANQQMTLSEKLHWKKGIARANNNLGVSYWAKSDYSKALEYYFEGLKMSEELNDKIAMTNALGNIGIIYFEQSNYSKALEFDLKAIKAFDELGDRKAVARNFGNVGEVYLKLHDYSKSLKYYFKAININDSLGRKSSKALNLEGIGDVYTAQSNYPKALEYYFPALNLNKELKIKRAIAEGLTRISSTYLSIVKNNNQDFLDKNFGGNRTVALQKAKKYADSSLLLSIEIGNLSAMIGAYYIIADVKELLGDYKGALKSYRNYTSTKDSVFNLEKSKKINQAIMQYEFDKKDAIVKAEQEKKDADARRIKTLQFAAIGFFVLVAIFLFWNNRQKQKAKIKIEKAYGELKTTQVQLIQSEKMASLGELTAGIAHEIQNPLNFVNNFSEVSIELADEMQKELASGNKEEAVAIGDDIKENLTKIVHHGKRADAIVKGMLQHSRSSTGKREPTDINALADEYLRLSYHGLRAKDKSFNTTLETNYDATLEKINIIPQDIGRVILNLFTNAFYEVTEKKKQNSSGYEPTVSVSTKKVNGKVEIKVADNGNGIPQKVLDKIFQPFFTTKPTGQGTGLGLSLSYDIVKAHGGEIKVKTKEEEGTEFIISLSSIPY